jgi:hypothetical protein
MNMEQRQEMQEEMRQVMDARIRWYPDTYIRMAFIVLSVGLLLIALGFFLRVTFNPGGLPAAVYRYTSAVEQLSNAPVCPGQSFHYPVKIDISKAPAAITIIETVWNEDERRTVISDTLPQNYAYITPVTIERNFDFTVPELPPGRYAVHHVAYESGTQPTGFSVRFEIVEGC